MEIQKRANENPYNRNDVGVAGNAKETFHFAVRSGIGRAPANFLSRICIARYADSDANFVLVISGSFEANSTKKLVEIVYDLLIETIQLGSVVMFEFGVGPVGLK